MFARLVILSRIVDSTPQNHCVITVGVAHALRRIAVMRNVITISVAVMRDAITISVATGCVIVISFQCYICS